MSRQGNELDLSGRRTLIHSTQCRVSDMFEVELVACFAPKSGGEERERRGRHSPQDGKGEMKHLGDGKFGLGLIIHNGNRKRTAN